MSASLDDPSKLVWRNFAVGGVSRVVIRSVEVFGDKADALATERRLRPDYGMGLNLAKGGERSGGGSPRFGAAKNSLAKRVSIAGVEYPTIAEAVKALGVKKTAIYYRLASPYFPD